MIKTLKKRKKLKHGKDILRHARHLLNMREDLMRVEELQRLRDKMAGLAGVLKQRDADAVARVGDDLYALTRELAPVRSHPGWRENIEILVVAVTVAMGVRTYFLQPFKIPTGSMQPTLYGITSRHQPGRKPMDIVPLNCVKWFMTGEWYRNVTVKKSGTIDRMVHGKSANDPANYHVWIAGKRYRIPVDAFMRNEVQRLAPGQFINKGEVLWSGIMIAGDHVFVDKLRWNLFKPKRDQVVVFGTDNIVMNDPVPQGTHYIKRLVGLPGEKISIDPPELRVNGEEPDCAGIRRVAREYHGYTPIGPYSGASRMPLKYPGDTFELREREYFAFGDNTRSSKDSRYWGAVPAENLVGPGLLVYWPFLRREAGEDGYDWQAGIIGFLRR